jgi:hypothetical protein
VGVVDAKYQIWCKSEQQLGVIQVFVNFKMAAIGHLGL